jgi:hypothetical protein
MKRFCLILIAATGICGWPRTNFADDAASAAAATAAAQRYEADYKRLADTVEGLIESQVVLRQQLSEAKTEILRLHEEIERNKVNPSSFASAEEARELTKKLREIDEKRQSDRTLILEEIETKKKQTVKEVKELLQALPVAHDSPAPAKTTKPHPKEKKVEKVKEGPQSEYEVQPGDNLSKIVAGLNKQGIKVTLDQILKANPGLKANTLYTGKKIIIPVAPPTEQ